MPERSAPLESEGPWRFAAGMDRTEIERLAVCSADGLGVTAGHARAIRDVDAREREDRTAIEALNDRLEEQAEEIARLKARQAEQAPQSRARAGDRLRSEA